MNNNRIWKFLTIILFCWSLILSFIVFGSHNNVSTMSVDEYHVSGFSTDLSEVVDECRSAVVTIVSNNELSSGFVYRQDGNKTYIVSTAHGIKGSEVNIYFDNDIYVAADVIGQDVFGDVSLLCCELPFKVSSLKSGSSSLLKAGEFTLCIGSPLSLDYANSVALAMVSSNERTIENRITYDGRLHVYYEDVIQLSSQLLEGYSGSPLLNMKGELLGMITMADDEIVFALTVEELEYIVDALINNVELNKLQLDLKGVFVSSMLNYEKTYHDISLDQLSGYYIKSIKNSSLAYSWGLRSGDLILSINGVTITDFKSLLGILYSNGSSYNFEISRHGEVMSILGSIDD